MMSEDIQRLNKSQSPQSKCNKSNRSSPNNQQQQIMEKDSENLQTLPTKQDMADMMSHVECMINGEMNVTKMDIKKVLQRVEETEEHLDEHRKAIMELRERAELVCLEMRNI